eukprot:365261-Chlamydomonas_euryale.AAC.5
MAHTYGDMRAGVGTPCCPSGVCRSKFRLLCLHMSTPLGTFFMPFLTICTVYRVSLLILLALRTSGCRLTDVSHICSSSWAVDVPLTVACCPNTFSGRLACGLLSGMSCMLGDL